MAAYLLESLRNYLISEGVVRKPSVAGSDPPMWLEPRNGVPAPGEGQNATERGTTAVLGAFVSGGIPPGDYDTFQRTDAVDIRLRTSNPMVAQDLEAEIRDALLDSQGLGYGKRNWSMDGMHIIETRMFRDLQRLGSDDQSYDWVVEYTFQRYA